MSIPSKSRIARHWRHKLVDWGEPSCWACGKYEEDSECKNSNEEPFKSWDGAKFLERCHIIPKMLGGSNQCSNLVLLCRQCHKESPDVKNPKFMWKWIANRKPYYHHFLEAMLEINLDAIKYASENIKEFPDYFEENAGLHGASISVATKTALIECFYESKKNT